MRSPFLFTGRNSSGSFKIRGVQLGHAIGADVENKRHNFGKYRTVVVVKRVPGSMLEQLQKQRKFWVWDVVDAWPQPSGNEWTKDQALSWLQQEIEHLWPSAIVFPTTQMLIDSNWKGPALVLPHHGWDKYKPQLISQAVTTIAYEGGTNYLGKWALILQKECTRRGWVFKNTDLEGADIGIALREYEGWPARNWKSNVKLANIQQLGIPAICSPEQGYKEFGCGSEIYVETEADLTRHLDSLSDYSLRVVLGYTIGQSKIELPTIAAKYKEWLLQINPA